MVYFTYSLEMVSLGNVHSIHHVIIIFWANWINHMFTIPGLIGERRSIIIVRSRRFFAGYTAHYNILEEFRQLEPVACPIHFVIGWNWSRGIRFLYIGPPFYWFFSYWPTKAGYTSSYTPAFPGLYELIKHGLFLALTSRFRTVNQIVL